MCTKALSNYFTYEISLPNAQSPAHRLCSATHRFYSFSPYFRAHSVNNNCSPSSPLLFSLSLSFCLYLSQWGSHCILLTLSISFSWNCVCFIKNYSKVEWNIYNISYQNQISYIKNELIEQVYVFFFRWRKPIMNQKQEIGKYKQNWFWILLIRRTKNRSNKKEAHVLNIWFVWSGKTNEIQAAYAFKMFALSVPYFYYIISNSWYLYTSNAQHCI